MNTYYTKCGRKFEKSTTAGVTGYPTPQDDPQCSDCPFRQAVMKGFPGVFDRWECRAGSKEPNQKNEWSGKLDDKNTIHIKSLHNDFLQSVIDFVSCTPEANCSYNQDLEDCRRTISISVSGNKKGIAAKKVIVEKFFGTTKQEVNEPTGKEMVEKLWSVIMKCEACKYAVDYGDSVEYMNCSKKRNKSIARKGQACEKFEQYVLDQDVEERKKLCIDCTNCSSSEKGIEHPLQFKCNNADHRNGADWYFNESSKACKNFKMKEVEDLKDKKVIKFESSETCEQCQYFTFDNGSSLTGKCTDSFKLRSGRAMACDNFIPTDVNNIEELDYEETSENCIVEENTTEKRKPRNIVTEVCEEMIEDCPCFCKHNDGCSVLLIQQPMLKEVISELNKKHVIDCDVYRKVSKSVNDTLEIANETSKNVAIENESPENVTKSLENINDSSVHVFDYSSVDEDTATFLHDKANKIVQIRTLSALAIGKELKEAHDKLSNHKNGTFCVWCESIGMSDRNARRYIAACEYIRTNCPDIEIAENIPTSLLFEISKPSAPQELQDKVLSGDISTHKQWKEKESEFKSKLDEKDQAIEQLRATQKYLQLQFDNIKNEKHSLEAELKAKQIIQTAKENQVKILQQQLSQAQETDDPKKIKELNTLIAGYSQEIENYQLQIGMLNSSITEKDAELRAKPFEVPAARIVEKEVLPDWFEKACADKLINALNTIKSFTKEEIQAATMYKDIKGWAIIASDIKPVSEWLNLSTTMIARRIDR